MIKKVEYIVGNYSDIKFHSKKLCHFHINDVRKSAIVFYDIFPKATEPRAHLETNLTRPPPPPLTKNIDNTDKKLIPRGINVLLMCNPLKKS